MSDQPLALSQYRPIPEVVRKETPVSRSRFPCIDAHNHLTHWSVKKDDPDAARRLVDLMDECNVQAMFDLRISGDEPIEDAFRLLQPRSRFYVLATIPFKRLLAESDEFGRHAASYLADQFERGADGLKMYKSMGLALRDRQDRLVHYDDPRLTPVFDVCARYNRPVLFHIADPTAFFKPLAPTNERWEELQAHPTWHFHGPQYPTFDELMAIQERFVSRYPDVKFQSAHVCSYAENLSCVAGMLDRHPNLHCDISARIAELGRVPRAARDFFLRYQDRILFGMDCTPTAEQFRIHFRFLETDDEHFHYSPSAVPGQGRWCIYGLNLPADVLKKVYRENALKLYGQPRA